MGQFESGKWIIILSLYFLVFFTLTYCIVADGNFDTQNVEFKDTGYGSPKTISITGSSNTTGDVDVSSPGMDNLLDSIKVMTSINSNSVDIGVPGGWKWLFSFLFFYLPFLMLLWSVYMALPFIH